MKKIYLFFLLFVALPGHGQYYSPFQPGGLAQYSTATGDTSAMLQLNKRLEYVPGLSVVRRDSIYSFAPRMKARRNGAGCDFSRYGGGVFGDVMGIDRPRSRKATYWLYGSYNATYQDFDVELLLEPYAPLNQVWNATYQHTAQVVARTVQPVLGVPDSVVTIAFSGGQQLRLSKHYGLIDGPALTYFASSRPARRFVLTALPRQHLGQPVFGTLAMYDFQPGDRLVYQYFYSVATGPTGPVRTTYLYSDSILSRANSRTADTVTYRILRFSQQGNVTTTRTENYTSSSTPLGTQASQAVVPTTQGLSRWRLLPDAVQSSVYPGGRAVLRTINVSWCGVTAFDTLGAAKLNVDVTSGADYATGLGHVRIHSLDFLSGIEIINTELVGYRKGTQTWGNLPRMAFATLAAGAGRAAATTAAFPNPFGDELAVAFTLGRPQAVGLVLRDALGRVVLEKAAVPLPIGDQRLDLATAGLPLGVYSLHLRFVGESRTEVMRVLKSQ